MPRVVVVVIVSRFMHTCATCAWHGSNGSNDEATQREVYLYNIIILCVVNKYVRGDGMEWGVLWVGCLLADWLADCAGVAHCAHTDSLDELNFHFE